MSIYQKIEHPASAGGISARGRMAVIAGLSAWLWAGLLTIGYYAIG